MPSLLITGINGQVGGYLASLDWPGCEVTLADRDVLDLSRLDELPDKLQSLAPDIIVNPAAYTAVDQAESEPEKAQAINAKAPAIMAEYLKSRDGLLVHFSTDYVFSGNKSGPYSEQDETGPTGVYGASKLAGEVAIVNSGVDHLILRTSWVYAHSGKNFFLTMLRLAAQRDTLTVVSDQHGTPTFALDLAEMTRDMVLAQVPARNPQKLGIFHLGNDGETSWHGFAEAIMRKTGNHHVEVKPVASSEFPTPARRPANSVLSKNHVLDNYPLTLPDWTQGLDRCIEIHRLSA